MRLRTAVAAGALAVSAPLTLAGVAQAQGDKDCTDFSSQKQAQSAFDKESGDPHHLDADSDKKACETWPPGPGDPSNAHEGGGDDGTEAPEGSVDAGGGGAAAGPGDVGPALAVAAGVGVAAGGAVLMRRRHTADRTDADA